MDQNHRRGSVSEPHRRRCGPGPLGDRGFLDGMGRDGVTAFFPAWRPPSPAGCARGKPISRGWRPSRRKTPPWRRRWPSSRPPPGRGSWPGRRMPASGPCWTGRRPARTSPSPRLGHRPHPGQLAGGGHPGPGEGPGPPARPVRGGPPPGPGGPGEGGGGYLGHRHPGHRRGLPAGRARPVPPGCWAPSRGTWPCCPRGRWPSPASRRQTPSPPGRR